MNNQGRKTPTSVNLIFSLGIGILFASFFGSIIGWSWVTSFLVVTIISLYSLSRRG